MNTAQLLTDIEQLPLEAQLQLEEFIDSIKKKYQPLENNAQPSINKVDETIDTNEFFGIWADRPRDLETIRKQAWQRPKI
jgi:hypothetical protein